MQPKVNHEPVLGKKIKDYFFCAELGRGSSARVYMAVDKGEKQVAIKAIPKEYLNSDKKLMELVKTEIEVLKSCCSENVIKCLDVFQTSMSIFIVTELCNGTDLQKYLDSKKCLVEDQAVMFLKQILNGFKGLHELFVMHRDFKLSNVLLHNRECKIADLGYAKKMENTDLTHTILGTRITMAPELLQGKPYGIKADIWAIGVVFYQMLTGQYPYSGTNQRELLSNIKSNPINFEKVKFSEEAISFIKGCLTFDPVKRISWIQIYNHPILKKTEMELVYGIYRSEICMTSNRNYYIRRSQDEENPESLQSLKSLSLTRNSLRKALIIEEIKSIAEKRAECDQLYRNSLTLIEQKGLIERYSISYALYLNKLSFPFKFLRLSLIKRVNLSRRFCVPIFFIYKKSLSELRQFLYIVKKKINILKIEYSWEDFLQDPIYNYVCNLVNINLNKAELLYEQVKNIVANEKELLKNESLSQEIYNKNFNELLSIEIKKAIELLILELKENTQASIETIELAQGLVFYVNQSVTVQKFDRLLSKPILNVAQMRNKVIADLQEIIQP